MADLLACLLFDLEEAVVAVIVVAGVAGGAGEVHLGREAATARGFDLHVDVRGPVDAPNFTVRVGEVVVVLGGDHGLNPEGAFGSGPLVTPELVAVDVVESRTVALPEVEPGALDGAAADVDDLANDRQRLADGVRFPQVSA